jgi:hypothetical protein
MPARSRATDLALPCLAVPKPGGEIAPLLKAAAIADRRHHRARDDGAANPRVPVFRRMRAGVQQDGVAVGRRWVLLRGRFPKIPPRIFSPSVLFCTDSPPAVHYARTFAIRVGGLPMFTSAECRAYAEQKEADRDEQHRERLITAAQAWLILASRISRLEAIPYTPDPPHANKRSKKRAAA